MLSAEGGVEIEQVAVDNPDAIAKLHIDPVDGLTPESRPRSAVLAAKLNPIATDGAADILVKLYTCFTEGRLRPGRDQPAHPHPEGKVHALDAKVSLDNNADVPPRVGRIPKPPSAP